MKIFFSSKKPLLIGIIFFLILICHMPALAATTGIHIVKYSSDKTTIIAEKTLTYQEMRDTLPVLGDGSTHYFHQGPVFVDDPDEKVEQDLRWNPGEDTNIDTKDMGAVMGTSVKDLCDLVGGMSESDTLFIAASDGLTKEFAYKNVYSPPARQGQMGITWYCSDSMFSTCNGPYPDSGYADGMRLVFFADTSVNPWGTHVFGNFDWHESADEKYWYYYSGGDNEFYPTTTGLSIKYISEIRIYSSDSPSTSPRHVSYGGGAGLPVAGSAVPVDPDLYGYKGKELNTVKTGTVNGSVRFFSDPDAVPVPACNRVRDFDLPLDIPSGSNITLARMYVYISDSQYIQGGRGIIPSLSARLNTTFLEPDAIYVDSDRDDKEQVAATVAYDVRELLKGNGTYTLSLRNMDQDQSVFTIDNVFLVAAYEAENATAISYWLDEGCDVILSQPEKGLFPKDAETSYSFSGSVNLSTIRDAYLYLASTGLDSNTTTEHTVRFNEGTWYNLFDNQSVTKNGSFSLTLSLAENRSAFSVVHLPVSAYMDDTGNTATVQSSIRTQDSDYLVNRNAFLIVEHGKPDSSELTSTTSGYVQPSSSPGAPVSSPLANKSSCCRITLDSDPEGALIYLDGTYLGKTTPSALEIPEGGMHTARFELHGYVPAEIPFTVTNSTSIRPSLYAPVHSTKGRLAEEPEDPDGTRYGGLFINSRPRSAMISMNGVSTGKVTPTLFMGLEPGSYTINLGELQDIAFGENDLFVFEEQTVWVLPEAITPVDINGIGYHILSDMIIDSHQYRGMQFTVNGFLNNKTLPAKVRAPLFESFITIHENESFVSYQIPTTYLWDEDRYLLFESRNHQDLNVRVNSFPAGAEVIIDGFRTGYTTPYTFGNISDGPHRITVTKNGYLPTQSLIDLPRRTFPISTTMVDVYLEEYPSGFLYVRSMPAGARISIDGMLSGEVTPALFKSVPTGTHLVDVKGTNATKKFFDVTVNSVYMTNLTADFIPHDDV